MSLHAVLSLGLAFALGTPQGAADAAEAWRAHDAAPASEGAERLEALEALGPPAALAGLLTLAQADVRGRLARAEVVRAVGAADCLPEVLDLLSSTEGPQARVRRELVAFLGEDRLERAQGPERVGVLVDLALDDPDPGVRRAAVGSLAAVDDPTALARLDGLLDRLPAGEELPVAEALASHAGASELLVRRVARAFEPGAERRTARTLAVLLDEYGDALAQLPGGALTPSERRPLVLGPSHPDPLVRLAANTALERLLARLAQLGELERAYTVIDALAAEGLEPLNLHYRKATLALTADGSAAPAKAAAEAILALSRGDQDVIGRWWRVRGELLLAGAEASADRMEPAREALARAAALLEGLAADRPDALPLPLQPALGNVDEAVQLGLLRCTVDLWIAFTWVAEGRAVGDLQLAGLLRRMHLRQLQVQLQAVQGRSRLAADGLQVLLDAGLGPLQLVCSNPASSTWPRRRALDVQLRLSRALAGVAQIEMPGFEPPNTEQALRDPLADPERRRLLEEILAAQDEALQIDFLEETGREQPDEGKLIRLRTYRAFYRAEMLKVREGSPAPLLRQRVASQSAIQLAQDLRADGSPTEARRLSDRMKDDLMAAAAEGGEALQEMLVARLEISVGSSWMDEGQPQEAEKAFLQAEARLRAYEDSLVDRRDSNPGDAELRAGLEQAMLQARSLRADVLLSLAVNANVRQGDAEKALGFFEQAYELKRTDFMRVLLACYRARSGRAGEARALLTRVAPNPTLYYNLACTHALLGDAEIALDYLSREFEENHPSERSRERQKEWARGDPDLAPLRSHPRFQRLVAPAGTD